MPYRAPLTGKRSGASNLGSTSDVAPDSPANRCIFSGKWAQKTSLMTLASLKKQATAATEGVYKLQEELAAIGSDVTSTVLKAVITQATTTLGSLDIEVHKSFCNCINDPRMKDLAIQFQRLNKQTSEALENIVAHPNASDAKERFHQLSKQTTEAYAALIKQSPAARNAANTVKKAVEQVDALCRERPVLCRWVATGLANKIFPGMTGLAGPLTAWVQSTMHGTYEPKGTLFSAAHRWEMGGMPIEAGAAIVGGPVAALLLVQMKRDWSPESCKNLIKGVEETAKL